MYLTYRPTEVYAGLRQAGADLLTPAMIKAGVNELLQRDTREDDAASVIRDLFQAIAEAAPECPLQST
jgi:hypothetical protein